MVALGAPWGVVVAALALWAISAWDDWASAPPAVRLAFHAAVAAGVLFTVTPQLELVAVIFLLFALIWSINLFNFMDGADGIAATAALVVAGALGVIAWRTLPSDARLPWYCFIVAGAALGFLPFNFPPARLFMGDGGSTLLGLMLAILSVMGAVEGAWPATIPIALLTPLWADATYTLIRRIAAGHSPFEAHRTHLYQRLALSGLGHKGLLWWMSGWLFISLGVALLAGQSASRGISLGLAALFAAFYVAFTEWALRRQPNLLMNPRALLALIFDVVAAGVAWAVLFWARFNFNIDDANFTAGDVVRSLSVVLPVHALVFLVLGLYQGLWRFASMADLRRIGTGAFTAAAATAVLFALIRPESFIVPRSVMLLQPILLIFLMGGARFAYRSWKEHRLYGIAAAKGEPVLVLGAGAAGARLVAELAKSETWHAVGLLDDDVGKIGGRVHNTPILDRLDRVEAVARRFGARHAIVAMPNVDHATRRRAVTLASEAGLTALTVPSYDEMLADESPLAKLRAIELEDLLGRDPVVLDTAGLERWIGGRTVLVTGAGGSIGTELCQQVARFHPARLILVDISEFACHQASELLAPHLPRECMEVYVGNARQRERLQEIFERERPAIVFHAAAYKHVPLTETVNAWEAVRNNVLGTVNAAECARAVGAERFVLISTDKAVRASSIMGASKRLAELAIMSYPDAPTHFVAVRFGNVLGSNGSVIPKFREQIARGGPVTVTHPDMTRYFMSIPEAAQLVLQAGMLGQRRSLYVLDMGTPVRIVELAQELIRLARGNIDAVPIVFTGLRPGEKMHEELTGEGETFTETAHRKVRRVSLDNVQPLDLVALGAWLAQPTPADVRAELRRWVADFQPADST
ncbi:MAG: polysaccharide biosynthesis protein [Burkholderiales bacterium]|nr:polysaccharide biosynthesis protein [Burkholderiales bacterium]